MFELRQSKKTCAFLSVSNNVAPWGVEIAFTPLRNSSASLPMKSPFSCDKESKVGNCRYLIRYLLIDSSQGLALTVPW